jgi:NAD(P)-dependent dehydrogenase (short-subunit alcohol dehydrogenase family)
MAGMLDGKVVVISGVGPALGTTLARRCAEAGADLVLAARTAGRLDDVASDVAALGRRAVAVTTDITDDEQVDRLVSESLAAYGKVDVLINNAFRVPSMKPLADTTFDHIRDAIELTVLGALRMIQRFTPRAGADQRVGGQRQLDGDPALPAEVRRLQDGEIGAAGHVTVAGHRTR